MSQALDDPDYVASTRGEAIPPEDLTPPVRTRRARPTVEDNPQGEHVEPERRPEPDEAVAAMARRAQAAEERAAALEAERTAWQKERDDLTRTKTEAESRGVNAQKQALLTEISAVDRQILAARQRRRAAREAGDLDAEDTAIDEATQAVARKQLLERDKVAWDDWEAQQAAEAEAAKSRRAAEPAPETRQQPTGARLTPKDEEWVGAHPEFKEDRRCERWIRAAADQAISDGVTRGSTAFYRELSAAYDEYQDLNRRRGAEPEPEPEQRRETPTRRSQPSAASMGTPPSRGNGGQNGSRGAQVSAAAVAKRLGVTEDEMRSFARGDYNKYVQTQAQELGMI